MKTSLADSPPRETTRLLGKKRLHHGVVQSELLELLRLRVAQIHRCPDAMLKHTSELLLKGDSIERVQQLETWGSSELFSGQERAALALCEKITHDPAHPLPDYLIREILPYFTPKAIVSLTLVIMAVNDWHFLGNHSITLAEYFATPFTLE